MAKKSFKNGLDNLLASAGIKKKVISPVISSEKKEKSGINEGLQKDNKYWLQIKNERLSEELLLWRTGKLSVDKFNSSLKEHGLKYKSGTNEIIEN